MQMQLLQEEVESLLAEINAINAQTLETIERIEASGNDYYTNNK